MLFRKGHRKSPEKNKEVVGNKWRVEIFSVQCKLEVVVPSCRPSILDVETEGPEAQGHPPLATQQKPPNAVIIEASLLLRSETLALELAFCRKWVSFWEQGASHSWEAGCLSAMAVSTLAVNGNVCPVLLFQPPEDLRPGGDGETLWVGICRHHPGGYSLRGICVSAPHCALHLASLQGP